MGEPRHFGNEQTTLFFDRDTEPLAVVAPGERFSVDTKDSICGLWKNMPEGGMHIDEVVSRLGGACPLTGPFFVDGAHPGDVIEVEIHSVTPNPARGIGWTGLFEGFGALSTDVYGIQSPIEAGMIEVPYADSVAHLDVGGRVRQIEMRPFLGTIGVAPALERRLTFSQAPEYLGDVDQPGVTAGATIVLPVNVEGALLSLGDAHGAQGDGEITGVAIEIEATADITVTVASRVEAGFVALPQLNTATTIGSIAGFQGVNLGDCARAAHTDLQRRLVRHHGFTESDAYRLLGQVGRLQVGNMIDPFYSVCASVERRFVEA